MTDTNRDASGLALPARRIPVPGSISAAAQQALANPGAAPPPWPAASDRQAWESLIAAFNSGMSAMFEAMPPFAGQTELRRVDATSVYDLIPAGIAPRKQRCALIHLHGGGFVGGGGALAGKSAQFLAARAQIKTYAVDYRMPPEYPFPAAVDDVVSAYRDVLTRHAHNDVVIQGMSAGAGLAAGAVLKLRDLGLPLPAGVVLHTPEVDLTESGDSFETNQFIDHVLGGRLTESIKLYAGNHDLRNPYLSPLFGDLALGFPPTLLISGTRDLFLSNTVRFHRALRLAGIEADLHVFEAMPHGGFMGAPEDMELLDEQVRFIERILGVASGK